VRALEGPAYRARHSSGPFRVAPPPPPPQAPVGAIGMWSVPPSLRPLAISICTIIMHLLGDVPSPPLTGYLQTRLEQGKPPHEAAQQWRVSLSIVSLCLLPAGLLFLWNAKVAGNAKDYRKKEEQSLAEAREAAHLRISGSGRRSSGGGGGAAAGAVRASAGGVAARGGTVPAADGSVSTLPLLLSANGDASSDASGASPALRRPGAESSV
jgi:hypothetical protein